jgi:hypothetical protein
MTNKDVEDYREEIQASLLIIKREIESLISFKHGWQSLAVQLSKLLCDGSQPLLSRVIPDPLFHPIKQPRFKSELGEDRIKFELYSTWSIKMGGGGMTINCFDETKSPINLSRWLDQIIIEVDGEPLSINEFIRIPRNKEAAHSDPRFNKLLQASKGGLTAVIGGESIEPLPLGLGVIGSYVYGRTEMLLNELNRT